MNAGLFTLLQDFDRNRPAVPGENLIKLGLGAAMLRGGLVSKVIGATLIYRAFQGKNGLTQILKGERRHQMAANDADAGYRRGDGYVEVAAPWPYEERVKVASDAQPQTTP
jgi:hypothetical protein